MRIGVVVLLAGCARTEHTPVDLELDVDEALPAETSTVRICQTDGPGRAFGAGDGRYALTGLSSEPPPEVTVDVLDAAGIVFGRVGPLLLDQPFLAAALAPCDACDPCIGGGRPAEAPVTLGVRFQAADDRGP